MKIMYPKPKRLHYDLELEDTNRHRQFDCIFYDICLDHAAHFLYQSFSCQGCTWYHEDTREFENYFDTKEFVRTLFMCESDGTADIEDLKSSAQMSVGVQIPSLAPSNGNGNDRIPRYKLEKKIIRYKLTKKLKKYQLQRMTDDYNN